MCNSFIITTNLSEFEKQKIIIDTDPGVDDALAIAYGIKAGLPIEAICSVYGNSNVVNSSANILTILELAGASIPVFQGASKPLQGINRLAESHGDNGMGGFKIRTNKKISHQTAVEHYIEILNQPEARNVTIVAIGPSTNLGQLIKTNPEIIKNAGQIIVMGGVFGEKGNVSPFAEFNVYNDPLALDLILRSGHPNLTIVPANVCRKVTFTLDVFDQINNPDLAQGLKTISNVFIDYYSNDAEYGGFNGGVMYDLLAIMFVDNPQLFTSQKACVRVETEDKERYGETVIVEGQTNCRELTDVDTELLKRFYISAMNR